jgi:hypothetical protein
VAHGTHGIHGKGDERREPQKRKGGEIFFTTKYTKDTKGGGRGFAHGTHGIHGKIEAGIGRGAGTRDGKRRTITRTRMIEGGRVAHGSREGRRKGET